MPELIRSDLALFLRTHGGGGVWAIIWGMATNFGLQALLVYRIGRWASSHGAVSRAVLNVLLVLPRWWVSHAYGIVIERGADIGRGLYIGHFGGIRVGECRMGDYCSIGQSVQIGPAAEGGSGPIIGNQVWIGAHSQILGPHTVGDGATVAAGSLIREDVPPNALVLGSPARLIHKNYDNSRLRPF